jgi:RNA polymerase sigma-70 factor (ECF subfamily)
MDRDPFGSDGEVEESWRSLRSDVRRRVRDEHAADDIVQETWLRALERGPEKKGRFRGWLHVVAKRLIYEASRSRRRRDERERHAAKPERFEGERAELGDSRVIRMLEGLPETYREVLRMRVVEELETADIARRLGRSQATVRSQLKRGLDLMRARLDGRGRSTPWVGILALLELLPGRSRWGNTVARWSAPAGGVACLVLMVVVVLASRFEVAPDSTASVASNSRSSGLAQEATVARAEPGDRVEVPTEAAVPSNRLPMVAGTVLDASRQPVEGAFVYVSATPKSEPRLVATSDDHGRFALQEIGTDRFLSAEHPDWIGSSRAYLDTASDPRALELALSAPAGTSKLHVVWADGSDVTNGLVRAEPVRSKGQLAVTSPGGRLDYAPRPGAPRTDRNGRAEVRWETEGRHAVTVTSPEFPAWKHEREIVYAGEAEVQIVVPLPVRRAGRVVDEGGLPVGGAQVELLDSGDSVLRGALADPWGRFEIDGVAPGLSRLRAYESGPCGRSCLYEGDVEPGSELELVVSEGFTLCGRATDAEVLAGWTVRLVRLHKVGQVLSVRTTTTDEAGRFTFAGCPTEANLRVDLIQPGSEVLFAWTSEISDRANIRLVPTQDGRPTARLEGEFRAPSKDEIPLLVEIRSQDPEMSLLLRPDPLTGRFTTPLLPKGGYAIFAWLPRHGTWRAGQIQLAAEETKKQLFEVPPTGRVSVEPTLIGGRTDQIMVRIDTPGFNSYGLDSPGLKVLYRELVADPDGKRFVADVAPGDYRVEVFVDGHSASRSDVCVESRTTTRCEMEIHVGIPILLRLVLPLGPLANGERLQLTVGTARESRSNQPLTMHRATPGGLECPVVLPVDATHLEITTTNVEGRVLRRGEIEVPLGLASLEARPTLEIEVKYVEAW